MHAIGKGVGVVKSLAVGNQLIHVVSFWCQRLYKNNKQTTDGRERFVLE